MPEDPPPPPRPPLKLKPKEDFARANPPPGAVAPAAANDVYAWRADQRAIEKRGGSDDLAAAPAQPNRRRRDFWLMFVAGNLILAFIVWWGRENVFLFVGGIAGMGAFSAGLAWVMFQVMGRY